MKRFNSLPPNALDEFANTFREWHYLIGGIAFGFLLGAEWAKRRFDN